MPLDSSFWLDETATVFVAEHGSDHPSLATVAPQAWQSVYYPVARASAWLLGSSEIAYRLPSIFAMAIALLLISRLAGLLIHAEARWFAVFACVALSGINYEARDARPYALGILVMSASVLFLVRWLEGNGIWNGVGFVAGAILLLRIHLLFLPCYAVFAVCVLAYKLRGRTALSWLSILVTLGLIGAVLSPVIVDIAMLSKEASAHVFANPPRLSELLKALQWRLILGCAMGAWLLRWFFPGEGSGRQHGVSLIVAWWLTQPVVLFTYYLASGNSVFVPRYLSIGLPGAALAATAVAALFVPVRCWRGLAAGVGVIALVSGGQWSALWPLHHNSDWRAAAAAVNTAIESATTPVLCPSPYIEARQALVGNGRYRLPGFFYSHLEAYPIEGRVVQLPYEQGSGIPLPGMAGTNRFVVYGWEPQVHAWRGRLQADRVYGKWRMERLGPFADVDVVVFHKPE